MNELFDPPLNLANRSRPAANCEVFQDRHRRAGEFGDDRRELVLLKDLLHLLHLHKALCWQFIGKINTLLYVDLIPPQHCIGSPPSCPDLRHPPTKICCTEASTQPDPKNSII